MFRNDFGNLVPQGSEESGDRPVTGQMRHVVVGKIGVPVDSQRFDILEQSPGRPDASSNPAENSAQCLLIKAKPMMVQLCMLRGSEIIGEGEIRSKNDEQTSDLQGTVAFKEDLRDIDEMFKAE